MTPPHPDAPLPACANADFWLDAHPVARRDIYSGPRCILNCTGDPLRSPLVTAKTVQWADGSIHEPSVAIESPHGPALTSEQARELAAALITAAAEVDGWLAR